MVKIISPDVNTIDFGDEVETNRYCSLTFLGKSLRDVWFKILQELSSLSSKRQITIDKESQDWLDLKSQVFYIVADPDPRATKSYIQTKNKANRLIYPFAAIHFSGEVDTSSMESLVSQPTQNQPTPYPFKDGKETIPLNRRLVNLGYNLKIFLQRYSSAEYLMNNLIMMGGQALRLDFSYKVEVKKGIFLLVDAIITQQSFANFESRPGRDQSSQVGNEIIIDVPFYVRTELITHREFPLIKNFKEMINLYHKA